MLERDVLSLACPKFLWGGDLIIDLLECASVAVVIDRFALRR
jgi:hypothetical protein